MIGEGKSRLSLADVRGEKWMSDKQKQTPRDVCGEATRIQAWGILPFFLFIYIFIYLFLIKCNN